MNGSDNRPARRAIDANHWITALRDCEKAISTASAAPDEYCRRAIILSRLGRYEDAVDSFTDAIGRKPDYPQAYNGRGNSLQALGRFQEAIDSYNDAIALKPDYAIAYGNRGNALQSLARYDEAIDSYRCALSVKSDYVDAYNNRGMARKRLGRFEEALDDFDRAIALSPDRAELHSNRGNVLQELKRFEDAVESYDAALLCNPHLAEAFSNRGLALRELGRFRDAIASFDKAIALRRDYHEAIWNRSLAHLQTGSFDLGWHGYEARKRKRQPVGNRQFARPEWLGETNIAGKTILVHWEQGFGDVIQFSRYVKVLTGLSADVLFAPQKELRSLMRRLDTDVRIVDLETDALEFDIHCPLLSLPLALRREVPAIPNKTYLSADMARVEKWEKRLPSRSKFRIGVVWRGRPIPDSNRSIILDHFERLLDPRFEFISLQKDVTDAEGTWLDSKGVIHLEKAITDFDDTAALCTLVDVVVSVDTSVAHLAGALGVPVWVLLTAVADWRWLVDREDSPWYPSMRLFRQRRRGDWDGVLARLEWELKIYCG